MKCETCDIEFTPHRDCFEDLCCKCTIDYRRIERGAWGAILHKSLMDLDTLPQIFFGYEYRSSKAGFENAQTIYNGGGQQ